MRKLRKIGKMGYPNDGNRDLFESSLNYNVLLALKTLIKHNNFDCVLIGHLIVGYHHKPYRTDKIELLVKSKDIKLKYFPYFKYYMKKDVNVILYTVEDFGLSSDVYDIIKSDSMQSNGFNIISPTYLTILYTISDNYNTKNESSIAKLIDNSKIDFNILNIYLNKDELKIIYDLIKIENKEYMMKHLNSYIKYNTCQIYEGSSGFAEVDNAFEDWVKYTNNVNQVLIGGMAIVNYSLDKDRTTEDIDFLFLQNEDIPNEVYGFKRNRKGAFQHNKTHVEIEVLTNDSINLHKEFVELVFKTAYQKDSYKIASPSAIVALKLGRFSAKNDKNDILSLLRNYDINIDEFIPYLSEKAIENWNNIKKLK